MTRYTRNKLILVFGLASLYTVGSDAAVLSIGHRGNSLFAPENTVAAFLACSNKADMVEFDVRVSKDGHLVVMHDWNVDRTTDGNGAVSNLTLRELKALDAGSWFSTNFARERIPTLEEALTNIMRFRRAAGRAQGRPGLDVRG